MRLMKMMKSIFAEHYNLVQNEIRGYKEKAEYMKKLNELEV